MGAVWQGNGEIDRGMGNGMGSGGGGGRDGARSGQGLGNGWVVGNWWWLKKGKGMVVVGWWLKKGKGQGDG